MPQQDRAFGEKRVEKTYFYLPEKKRYCAGQEFDRWFEKYEGRWPYHRSLWNSNLFPNSRRPACFTRCRCFNDFYVANLYLEAGYEVLAFYRPNDCGSKRTLPQSSRATG